MANDADQDGKPRLKRTAYLKEAAPEHPRFLEPCPMMETFIAEGRIQATLKGRDFVPETQRLAR